MSINRWMDTEDVVHIYNGIVLSHKKEQNWVICSDVDEPRVCHTKWSQKECIYLIYEGISSVQFSSVTQSCPTLCDPMNRSTPGLPVHHQLRSPPKPMSIELVMSSNHIILCRPLLLLPSIFPNIRVFSNESAVHIRWQSIGVSASTSVLPMNTQDWSPFRWTGWILRYIYGI